MMLRDIVPRFTKKWFIKIPYISLCSRSGVLRLTLNRPAGTAYSKGLADTGNSRVKCNTCRSVLTVIHIQNKIDIIDRKRLNLSADAYIFHITDVSISDGIACLTSQSRIWQENFTRNSLSSIKTFFTLPDNRFSVS